MKAHDGALQLHLTWARGGRPRLVSETNQVYSVKAGHLLRARVALDGACTEYTQLSSLSKRCAVEMPPFAELDVSSRPLLVRDFACASTALYPPEPV